MLGETPFEESVFRKRGAQPRNYNALKHGFYSKRFQESETADLALSHTFDLTQEILLLRVLMRRTFEQSAPDSPDYTAPADLLRLAALTASNLTRLIKLQRVLDFDQASKLARENAQEKERQRLLNDHTLLEDDFYYSKRDQEIFDEIFESIGVDEYRQLTDEEVARFHKRIQLFKDNDIEFNPHHVIHLLDAWQAVGEEEEREERLEKLYAELCPTSSTPHEQTTLPSVGASQPQTADPSASLASLPTSLNDQDDLDDDHQNDLNDLNDDLDDPDDSTSDSNPCNPCKESVVSVVSDEDDYEVEYRLSLPPEERAYLDEYFPLFREKDYPPPSPKSPSAPPVRAPQPPTPESMENPSSLTGPLSMDPKRVASPQPLVGATHPPIEEPLVNPASLPTPSPTSSNRVVPNPPEFDSHSDPDESDDDTSSDSNPCNPCSERCSVPPKQCSSLPSAVSIRSSSFFSSPTRIPPSPLINDAGLPLPIPHRISPALSPSPKRLRLGEGRDGGGALAY